MAMEMNSVAVKRIVVIGGTGNFGARICRRIVAEQGTETVVTSRSRQRAQAVVDGLCKARPGAAARAARLDQKSPEFERELRALRPDIVVHTAGPYQGQDYRVAKACIEVGSHYVDLADGRAFVEGFNRLDAEAKSNNVLLVSGASTLPGLSSVVIDSLRHHFESVEAIEMSIAPAHRTPRGRGTMAGVLSYCGKPFQVLTEGKWAVRYGWQHIKVQRYPDLGLRLSGACDVPDLGLLPQYVDGVKTVTFHAALEAKWEQIALWSMGRVTRAGLINAWDRFIPAFQWLNDRLISLGSDVGGMHIKLSGLATDRKPKSVTWRLTARRNHGPEIPCSPALILARKLAADAIATRGAMPCLGLFSMAEFSTEVAGFDINWNVSEGA